MGTINFILYGVPELPLKPPKIVLWSNYPDQCQVGNIFDNGVFVENPGELAVQTSCKGTTYADRPSRQWEY